MALPTASPPTPTVSGRLADYVTGLRYDDIPPPVVERAKQSLGHLLGTAFHGHELDGSPQVVGLAHRLSGAEGGDCSVIGEPRRVNLLEAAFANSFLISRSGLDDYLLPQGAHPGIAAQPVAWALGEATRATGRELLTAIVVGYDVLSRLCDPMLTWGLEVFRPATFVLEPFGAVATAARLLNLTSERTVYAFGHAGQVSAHRVTQDDGSRTIHSLIARGSAMAALLADTGMPASPSIFEGEYGVFRTYFSCDVPEAVEAGLMTLGDEFAIADAHVKRLDPDSPDAIPRHPAVIPVELVRRLLRQHALGGSRVADVEVVLADQRRVRETSRDRALLGSDPDATTRQASLSFRIATVIADDGIEPDRFERTLDADLGAILDRIRLRFEPGHPLLYTRIELTTAEQEHHVVVDDGDCHEPPLSDWPEWIVRNGRPFLAERRLHRLVELIRNLDEVSDVAELMGCVVPDTA